VGFLDDWKYCPRCAAVLAISNDRVDCAACGFFAYGNSIPGTEAVIVDAQGRVLLGRRAFEPHLGRWDLPGGFLHEAEAPLDALHREVAEETGLSVAPDGILGMWNEPYQDGRTVLCLTWFARPSGGDMRAADDVTELRWFAAGDVPWDDLAFDHDAEAIRLGLRRHQDT
jgi:ADP-ribose pyrophosphatase YjhB (NUDIX family)